MSPVWAGGDFSHQTLWAGGTHTSGLGALRWAHCHFLAEAGSECLRISVMARGRGHLCQHRVGRQAAWEGTWGWHTSPRRLMFDLKPCVFPLGIFILCTWQWAAGCLPLWARNVAGGAGGGGEQLSWGAFGKGPAAGRLGALEPRATWTHYFSHHCDQILDKKKQCMGGRLCFVYG